MYEEKQKKIYEIETNEDGFVIACFIETITTVYKDSKVIAQNRHRDVVDLSYIQPIIAGLEIVPSVE